jgi:phage FluMu protein Com
MAADQPTLDPEFADREMEAEYTLEYPVKCPACDQIVRSLEVVRLLRTKVNFTSTLPRRGRVIVCAHCKKILSAELAGFA